MDPQKVSISMSLQKQTKQEPRKAIKKVDNNAPFFYPSYYFSSSKFGTELARMNTIMMMNKQLLININTCYRTTRYVDDSKMKSKKFKESVALRRMVREGRLQSIDKENATIMKRIKGATSSYNQELLRKRSRILPKSTKSRNNGTANNAVRWSILPEGELSNPDKRITCFFDITIDKIKRGRLLFEIYCDIVPKTAMNFISLCESEVYPNYRKTTMHQVFPGYFCIGGEVNNFLTKDNKRLRHFPDENHNLQHAGPGVISMFNSKPNRNRTQFLITFKKMKNLDGRFVVFGRLKNIKSFHILEMIEEFGRKSGLPKKQIIISDCGVL